MSPNPDMPIRPVELATFHAPAIRVAAEDIRAMARALSDSELIRFLMDGIQVPVLLLNATRQVVMFNEAAADLVPSAEASRVVGRRPGEILGCSHASEGPAGCGTAVACQSCEIVNGILGADWAKHEQSAHAHITTRGGLTLDFEASIRPLHHAGERLTMLTVSAIRAVAAPAAEPDQERHEPEGRVGEQAA